VDEEMQRRQMQLVLLAEGRHDDHDEGAGTYIVSLSLNSGGDAAVVTENLKS